MTEEIRDNLFKRERKEFIRCMMIIGCMIDKDGFQSFDAYLVFLN